MDLQYTITDKEAYTPSRYSTMSSQYSHNYSHDENYRTPQNLHSESSYRATETSQSTTISDQVKVSK